MLLPESGGVPSACPKMYGTADLSVRSTGILSPRNAIRRSGHGRSAVGAAARLPPMTRSPVELVIFDCDGVLVDSERICVTVDAMIMAELGCPFTEAEIIERFVGSSDEVYTAAVEQRLGLPP